MISWLQNLLRLGVLVDLWLLPVVRIAEATVAITGFKSSSSVVTSSCSFFDLGSLDIFDTTMNLNGDIASVIALKD
jgi:hypothetical protein